MRQPRRPQDIVAREQSKNEPDFVTWEEGDVKGRAAAVYTASRAMANLRQGPVIQRSIALNTYENIGGNNVSIREGFDKADYDYFRPNEGTPRTQQEDLVACNNAYRSVGLVRNVVDLMGDFIAKGVKPLHPNPRIQEFYQQWWKKVRGADRTERMANLLCRMANVVVRRSTAKLKTKDVDNLQKGVAADINIEPKDKVPANEIPWRYTIYNPMQLDVVGHELAPFIGPEGFIYQVKIPDSIIKKAKNAKGAEKQLIDSLPDDIKQALNTGAKHIQLDKKKVTALYYKRDDWQVWATPMIASIIDDLVMLKKTKLADLAALDGAISHIRLWKLGSLEHRILPTENAINRLAEILMNNVGGGAIDLIWGPELTLEETDTNIHNFLGDTKYAPILCAIYAGLGIPPTLTGAGKEGGFTNNFISLKTLTERLEYVRQLIIEFWEAEFKLVQQAMGFRFSASLWFDRMVLSDEAAEKALLIQLADRDLISVESLQERFGECPEIEDVRIRREMKARIAEKIPRKAGPFHSDHEGDLEKIFAQLGVVTPSELDVELLPRKPGEVPAIKQKPPASATPSGGKKKGIPQQGRPKNKKDSTKRKQKTVKPRTAAFILDTVSWAEKAQATINELTAPAFLQAIGKKNQRQLTDEEMVNFENFKFAALCALPIHATVDETTVAALLGQDLAIPGHIYALVKATTEKYIKENGHKPSIEETRRFQAGAYAFNAFKAGDSNNAVS